MSTNDIKNVGREIYKHHEFGTKQERKAAENFFKALTQDQRKLLIKIIKDPRDPALKEIGMEITALENKLNSMKDIKNIPERNTNLGKKMSRSFKNAIGKRTSTSMIFDTLAKDHKKFKI